MQVITIAYDADGFELVSHGNGSAYDLIWHKPFPYYKNLFFQGDDAIQFWNEFDAMENANPDRLTQDILRELWNNYEVLNENEAY